MKKKKKPKKYHQGTKHSLKFTNKRKKQIYNQILEECHIALAFYINYLFNTMKDYNIPKFMSTKYVKPPNTKL